MPSWWWDLEWRSMRTYYRVMAVFVGVVALLKGIQPPALWAYDQAQFDYHAGFMKRGLIGEACRRLSIPVNHYSVFCWLSVASLAIFFAVMFYAAQKSGVGDADELLPLIAGSMCVTYAAMLIGMYDIVLATFVFLVIAARPSWQFALSVLLGVIGVLIHELYGIAFLLASLCGMVLARRVAAAVALPIVAGFDIYVLLRKPISPEQSREFVRYVSARGVPWDFHMWMVFGNTAGSGWKLMRPLLMSGHWWSTEVIVLVAFIPTAMFFLWVAFSIERGGLYRLYMVVATLAPMVLNLVAIDRMRWLTMMEINALACLVAAAWQFKRGGGSLILSTPKKRIASMLILCNLAVGVGLFGGRASTFPFEQAWNSIKAVL